jgi:hypothetical protein
LAFVIGRVGTLLGRRETSYRLAARTDPQKV